MCATDQQRHGGSQSGESERTKEAVPEGQTVDEKYGRRGRSGIQRQSREANAAGRASEENEDTSIVAVCEEATQQQPCKHSYAVEDRGDADAYGRARQHEDLNWHADSDESEAQERDTSGHNKCPKALIALKQRQIDHHILRRAVLH